MLPESPSRKHFLILLLRTVLADSLWFPAYLGTAQLLWPKSDPFYGSSHQGPIETEVQRPSHFYSVWSLSKVSLITKLPKGARRGGQWLRLQMDFCLYNLGLLSRCFFQGSSLINKHFLLKTLPQSLILTTASTSQSNRDFFKENGLLLKLPSLACGIFLYCFP